MACMLCQQKYYFLRSIQGGGVGESFFHGGGDNSYRSFTLGGDFILRIYSPPEKISGGGGSVL